MTPRAPALPVTERRAALIAATIPLLHTRGLAVTTKEVAQAAGVAEGTIFRAFGSKDELVMEAIQAAFSPDEYIAELAAVDQSLPLEDRVAELIRLTKERFRKSFTLMRAVGMIGPPGARHSQDHAEQLHAAMRSVLEGLDDEPLRVPPAQVASLCRMLAFATENPRMNDGDFDFSPELLTQILLHGVRTEPKGIPCS